MAWLYVPAQPCTDDVKTCSSVTPDAHATVTVNAVELVDVPPVVVMPIFPVVAPVGTLVVTCVSEFTVKLVAATPPNVTAVV